jgi:8-hydroxy-5-deazaflavin:NADPH oxidoreductase
MNITILGTGSVGQALAGKLSSLSHAITMGTRDVNASLAKKDNDGMGNPGVGKWIEQHSQVSLSEFSQSVKEETEIVIIALSGTVVMDVLKLVGEANLKDKLIIDISNPLDFSNGFPPTLFVCNDESLGELIQQQYPNSKVVKTLNTMSNAVMINPNVLEGDHSVFMSGDNADAKLQVETLLESFGWKSKNIIDLGNITTSRGTEMMLPLWVRLFGKLNTPYFNIHINQSKM